jgi:DNA-binding XRE family transcriptional regulator
MLVKLRGKRVEKGYSQQELAKLLEISTNAYNLKERGIREFRVREINMLLKLLECKYEDIFLQ